MISLLLALGASLQCWKPHPFIYRARYWIEISAVADRADVLRFEYGTGTDEAMTDVYLVDTVVATGDAYRTEASNPMDLAFKPAKNSRYDLEIRDRSRDKVVSRMRGFRCD